MNAVQIEPILHRVSFERSDRRARQKELNVDRAARLLGRYLTRRIQRAHWQAAIAMSKPELYFVRRPDIRVTEVVIEAYAAAVPGRAGEIRLVQDGRPFAVAKEGSL